MPSLAESYPWTSAPLIAGAPMRTISHAPLAVAVSAGYGLGFIGAGDDLSTLDSELAKASRLAGQYPALESHMIDNNHDSLPIGVGLLTWGADIDVAAAAVAKWKPAAVWLFGAYVNKDYIGWTEKLRAAGQGKTKIWIQVFSVADAVEIAKTSKPDTLVIQGTDAGGHGREGGAGIIALLPEVYDALHAQGITDINLVAAGGIADGRGVVAALSLGAEGVAMGTRLLASKEATISEGYQAEVLRTSDGGVTTARTSVYDQLRGTTRWPAKYDARGILNQSYYDSMSGMNLEENKRLYEAALKDGNNGWGVQGRLATYAGTAVGLVHEVMSAIHIVMEVHEDTEWRLKNLKNGSRIAGA